MFLSSIKNGLAGVWSGIKSAGSWVADKAKSIGSTAVSVVEHPSQAINYIHDEVVTPVVNTVKDVASSGLSVAGQAQQTFMQPLEHLLGNPVLVIGGVVLAYAVISKY